MGAVLVVSAKECQIVIFTCVPERYAFIGEAAVVPLQQALYWESLHVSYSGFYGNAGDFLKVLGELKEEDSPVALRRGASMLT
jgi:hypothetical protein